MIDRILCSVAIVIGTLLGATFFRLFVFEFQANTYDATVVVLAGLNFWLLSVDWKQFSVVRVPSFEEQRTVRARFVFAEDYKE